MSRRILVLVAVLLPLAAFARAEGPAKLPQRSDIAPQYKWRLEDIYATNDLWEADFKRLEGLLPRVASFQGHLGQSADSLLAALRMDDSTGELTGRLFVYAHMRQDEDTRVTLYQGMADRIRALSSRLGEAGAFMDPEILAIPPATLTGFYRSAPGLELYRHKLDNLQRTRVHTLSEKEEKLLAMSSEATGGASRIFHAFDDADLRYGTIKDENGKDIQITKGRYQRCLESPDRRVRRDAFKAFYKSYVDFNNTLAATHSSNVKKDIFYARARGYEGSLAASLDGSNIPLSVYQNLVSTVNANLAPLRRYRALRRKWMGLDTLHIYDLYAPLVPDAHMEITFEQAKKNVLEGLKPMGPEYLDTFRHGLESGWIDVYETEGKTSGAYNWGSYSTHPYVLMNCNNTLEDEFTLAHEMGHAMHSYFSHKYQPYVYGGYATFIAEVASTTNEATLINYLLQQPMARQQKLYLLNFYLEQFRTTFFRQTLFAEFEMRAHEMAEKGEALTPAAMNKLYRDLYHQYYGDDLSVDEAEVEWSRIPHFYTSFYVYQYATSYAAATALSQKILKEGPAEVTRYLSFLKSGSSDYPIEVLKKAGIDMSRPEPIQATIDRFSQVLDEMEKLWNEK